MLNTWVRSKKDEEGFTLIELLVVVIIIGILAAIAIPTFLNQRQRGWQAELTSNVRNTALDLEAGVTAGNGTPLAGVTTTTLPSTVAGIGVGATPPTVYRYVVTGNNFCLAGERQSGLTGVVGYRSGAGGIVPFSATATLAGVCP